MYAIGYIDEIRDGSRRPTGSRSTLSFGARYTVRRWRGRTPGRCTCSRTIISYIIVILFDYNPPRDRVNDRNTRTRYFFFLPRVLYIYIIFIIFIIFVFVPWYLLEFFRKLILTAPPPCIIHVSLVPIK